MYPTLKTKNLRINDKSKIYKKIVNSLKIKRKTLKSKKFIDLRKDLKLCLEIENILKKEVINLIPKKNRNNFSIQFPPNIRFVSSDKSKMMKHKYSTDNLHTDVWSGAPLESRNFIYYVLANKKTSYCTIYKSLRGNRKLENYRGSYSKIKIKTKLIEQKYKINNGKIISFDSMCPHKTYFPIDSKGLRISIDFRVKYGNPYTYNKCLVSKKKFCNSKIGQPGLGYYWIYSKKQFRSLKDKINEELNIAKKLSNKFYHLRKEYIKLNYKKSFKV